jgi:four helix bundle protein
MSPVSIFGMRDALERGMPKSRDLRVRSFQFAVDVVRFARSVALNDAALRRLALQLIDAVSSVGANLEEAAAGQTK